MQLFHPDYEVPATRIIFDTDAMAARIRPWLGARNVSLSISNIRYKPNTSCLVSYVIETEKGISNCHVKAFQITDWAIRKRNLTQTLTRSPLSRDVLIDNEFAFALFRFPSDCELPGIGKFASNPQDFLSRVLFQNFSGECFSGFTTLAYKPNRRYTAQLRFESGNRFVLKVHDPSSFGRALVSSRVLKTSLLVDTPRRVGRSNRHRALAHDWIEGSKCDFATIDRSEHKSLMESVFEYLDRLHSGFHVTTKSLPVQTPEDGLGGIADYLATIYPPIAESARRICDDVLANLSNTHPLTSVHGDFHEEQIILSPDRVKACDFDNCSLGDPTTDLANFVAHLHYRASLNEISMVDVAQINHWSMRYLADNGGRDAMNRYLWNQMAGMLRLSTHPFRSGAENWMEITDEFMSHLAAQIEFVRNTVKPTAYTSRNGDNGSGKAAELNDQGADVKESFIPPETIQNDPRFQFLGKSFSRFAAEQAMGQLEPTLDEIYGPFEVADIIVRRHKPGRRCLVEYELATTYGRRSILGKALAKRLDQTAFDTQKDLYLIHGFGGASSDGVSVPRPLGCFEPWRMWFQEKVSAKPGAWFLEHNQLGAIAKRIAIAIAKFHTCDFSPLRQHSIADELVILDDRLNQVAAELPADSDRILRVLSNCVSIADAIENSISVPIHRDFYHDQIMFSDERTYLVDLDLVSFGHPALDVGNFLAHLTEHAVRRFDDPNHWIEEENEIVNHYLSRVTDVDSSEIAALKAISFARHIYISWTMKDRCHLTSKIIDTALELTNEIIHRPKLQV